MENPTRQPVMAYAFPTPVTTTTRSRRSSGMSCTDGAGPEPKWMRRYISSEMTHRFRSLAHSRIALSSALAYTAPVGLTGVHRMMPAVRASLACSRSSTLALRLHCGSPGTITGVARARCTNCG